MSTKRKVHSIEEAIITAASMLVYGHLRHHSGIKITNAKTQNRELFREMESELADDVVNLQTRLIEAVRTPDDD